MREGGFTSARGTATLHNETPKIRIFDVIRVSLTFPTI
jgi:hypothetical protein